MDVDRLVTYEIEGSDTEPTLTKSASGLEIGISASFAWLGDDTAVCLCGGILRMQSVRGAPRATHGALILDEKPAAPQKLLTSNHPDSGSQSC